MNNLPEFSLEVTCNATNDLPSVYFIDRTSRWRDIVFVVCTFVRRLIIIQMYEFICCSFVLLSNSLTSYDLTTAKTDSDFFLPIIIRNLFGGNSGWTPQDGMITNKLLFVKTASVWLVTVCVLLRCGGDTCNFLTLFEWDKRHILSQNDILKNSFNISVQFYLIILNDGISCFIEDPWTKQIYNQFNIPSIKVRSDRCSFPFPNQNSQVGI